MARLIASAITSLDGYTVDADGSFDWCAPDEEVHAFVNDRERDVGTYLYGRRMYEVMTYWQQLEPGQGAIAEDYARIWQAADKVVWSRTLTDVTIPRTRLERDFDPAAVRALVAAADRDVSIGGPTLAAEAFRAGLVDEVQLYLNPVAVGAGTRALPDGCRLDLALVEQHTFAGGVVFVRYRCG